MTNYKASILVEERNLSLQQFKPVPIAEVA